MSKVTGKMSNTGFSIVELLVVTMVFSILAVLTTQSIFLTLRASRKSESITTVRENIDLAFAVMERQLRNAKDVDCANSDDVTLIYNDENGNSTSFSCETQGIDTFIASGSASNRLTNPDVVDITCSAIFTCDPGGAGVPPSVIINISAQAVDSTGAEGEDVATSTRVLLRSY